MHGCRIYILATAALFCIASIAHGHSPYFSERIKIEHPDWGSIDFAILNGDGIFFADPGRVVVIDPQGELLAIGPLTPAPILTCRNKACIDMRRFGVWSLSPIRLSRQKRSESMMVADRLQGPILNTWRLSTASAHAMRQLASAYTLPP